MTTHLGRPAAGAPDPSASDRQAEVFECAAQLGITPERVLQEYASIAFADLRRLVDWGPEGVTPKPATSLTDAEAAAVSEVVPIVSGDAKCRIKLHDKKAALDAVARILGMFRRHSEPKQGNTFENGVDPREAILRRLAELATGGAEDGSDLQPVSRGCD